MKKLLLVVALTAVMFMVFVPQSSYSATPSAQPAAAAGINPAYTWAKTWGGSLHDRANNVVVDQSGNKYVVGEFAGTVNFDPAGPNPGATRASVYSTTDAFVSKFDASGNLLWVKTFGGGPINPDLICKGYPTGDGRDSVGAVALDSAGNVYISGLFQYTVDFGSGYTATSHVAPHQDMCGYTNRSGNDAFVARLSPADGTTIWARTWGGTAGSESYSLVVDKFDHVYVQGDWSTWPLTMPVNFNPVITSTADPHYSQGAYDAFLSKFDTSGNLIWAKTWGGEGYDDGPGVATDEAGNVYVTGMYASKIITYNPANNYQAVPLPPANDSGSKVDVFLVKFNSAGVAQWVRTWGGQGTDEATGPIIVDDANNVYVAGRFGCKVCVFSPTITSTVQTRGLTGTLDAFVSKYDSAGNFRWIQTWGGAGDDGAGDLALDQSNHLYVNGIYSATVNFDPAGVGYTRTTNGLWDVFLTQLDTNGSYQWAQTWGGSGDDLAGGVSTDSEQNVYMTGGFSSTVDFDPGSGDDHHDSNGQTDAFFSKFVALPASPIILSPPNGAITTSHTITLMWQAGSGNSPIGYNLDLDGHVITTSATTSSTLLATGIHTWTVRAYNDAGYSTWATPRLIAVYRYNIYLPLAMRSP